MMSTSRHQEVDATPTPREVDNMAAVHEGRHGVHAEHVAQFFDRIAFKFFSCRNYPVITSAGLTAAIDR